MIKNLLVKLTIALYVIFTLSTITLIIIQYKNIDSPLIFKFAIGYVIFLILFFVYIVTLTTINMKKLKWVDIRKRLLGSLLCFILLSASMYIIRIMSHRPSKGIFGDLAIPLGAALGFAFLDLILIRKEND